jgi:WD40 repeat protein
VISVAFSPDASVLATAHADEVNLWNSARFSLTTSLKGAPEPFSSVAFFPDLRGFASFSSSGWVKLWDLQAERKRLDRHRSSFLVEGTKVISSIDDTRSRYIGSVVISPNGEDLALVAMSHAQVFDMATGKSKFWLRAEDSLAFSPDGKTLASGHKDGSICIWDPAAATKRTYHNEKWIAKGAWQLRKRLSGHKGSVHCLAFSFDGKTLASGGKDGVVMLWNLIVASNEPAATFNHSGAIRSVAFSRNGTTLASSTDEGIIRLWRAASGVRVMRSATWTETP